MNDKVTISTFKLFEMFTDQEAARVYLERRRWPNGPTCPKCPSGERITVRKGGYYHYHHVSGKHLGRYCGEFAFRPNDGSVERHTLDRLASLADATVGRRLTYKELTA